MYEDLITGIVWLIAGILSFIYCRRIVDYTMKTEEALVRLGIPQPSERVHRIIATFVVRSVAIGLIVFGSAMIYQFFSGKKIVY